MSADFTLTPEECKHLANHLVGASYPHREDAAMTVTLLLRLGYSAELEKVEFDEEAEWAIHCAELEVPA